MSRRTAERLRDAVRVVFGPLEPVDAGEAKRHWRLRAPVQRRLVAVSGEELAELTAAADALDRTGLEERGRVLRRLADKLRSLLDSETMASIEPEVQALTEAEGPAMRPGPRPRLDDGLPALLRHTIKATRVVEFDYRGRTAGRSGRRHVEPYGLIYGHRAFLAGRYGQGSRLQLWRLASISAVAVTDASFTHDPAFDLEAYARRSFGTFQEDPVAIVLSFAARGARDAAEFVFHPDQTLERNDDGSLTVGFAAGGIKEICWHLVTWGTAVTVE